MDLGLRTFISYHLINLELKRMFCKYDKKTILAQARTRVRGVRSQRPNHSTSESAGQLELNDI